MSGVGVDAAAGGGPGAVALTLPDGWEAAIVDGSVLAGLALERTPAGGDGQGAVGALEVRAGATGGEAVATWVGRCLAAVPAGCVVSVPGRDLLAEVLRAAAPPGSGEVAAVLDTSSSSEEAGAVVEDLAGDDVLVLCALPPAPDLSVDAYGRIHRRRGSIVGPVVSAEPAARRGSGRGRRDRRGGRRRARRAGPPLGARPPLTPCGGVTP